MCSQFLSIINLRRSCQGCLESIKMPVVWPNGKRVDSNNTSVFLSRSSQKLMRLAVADAVLPSELCERMSPKSNQIMAVIAYVKPSLWISAPHRWRFVNSRAPSGILFVAIKTEIRSEWAHVWEAALFNNVAVDHMVEISVWREKRLSACVCASALVTS